MTTADQIDGDTSQWELARSIGVKYGTMNPLFVASIRAIRHGPTILKTDEEADLRAFAVRAASFPVKISPSLKAAFYFAALEKDEQALRGLGKLDHEKLLMVFSADEISAVITLVSLFRLLRCGCDVEEWQRLTPKIGTHVFLGWLLGSKIPSVGGGNGMLMAGLRFVGLGCLLATSVKGFKELRRKTERAGRLFDRGEELRIFGCTHLHVACHIASITGNGLTPGLALGVPTADSSGLRQDFCPEAIAAWNVAIHLSGHFSLQSAAPFQSNVLYLSLFFDDFS